MFQLRQKYEELFEKVSPEILEYSFIMMEKFTYINQKENSNQSG